MADKVCISCRVEGRVQGVWFRASAKAAAERLGLTGYARNLPDGSVAVLACGPADQVDRMRHWLWQGPERAEVSLVDCEAVDDPGLMDFQTA